MLPEDLPPAAIFKPETPRYPNVWFYAAESEFESYPAFIESLARRFQTGGYTDDMASLNEGADLALSIENLQPWTPVSRLSHSHAIHVRFFWKRLLAHQSHRVRFGASGSFHWRVAASVHYEVEHPNPLHADVEVCPICGRTGAYAGKEGSLVERVHDPLGLELLLWGTVREGRSGSATRRRSAGIGRHETVSRGYEYRGYRACDDEFEVKAAAVTANGLTPAIAALTQAIDESLQTLNSSPVFRLQDFCHGLLGAAPGKAAASSGYAELLTRTPSLNPGQSRTSPSLAVTR
jgi:hypothetical protein